MSDTVRRARAVMLRCQAAQLVLTAQELFPVPGGAAAADELQRLAEIGLGARYQHSDHVARARLSVVAPQGGEGQSIEQGQSVHAAHDHASEAFRQ